MKEPPNHLEQHILSCIGKNYGLTAKSIQKHNLGRDFNTLVYHMVTTEKLEYFLKLRMSEFSKPSVQIPYYLKSLGMQRIIAPLKALNGELWIRMESSYLILYPYVEGKTAVESGL